ncbi:hypothetical protein LEN26_001550 [Aphanomyces euteiches]|nr:hypothetical protein AeMF1_000006 [Aphanomyces euteiches]KAH9161181.1 hypothetical protein LEN26_001550 [Aphanomyces euteiches]KAH9194226.1 hypothetical protein AeNC1_003805 [Aphanomyces euteiches]
MRVLALSSRQQTPDEDTTKVTMSSTIATRAPSSNGNVYNVSNEYDLFSQQLEMYATLGRKESQKAATAKARTEAEFLALMSAYFSGTEPKDYRYFLPNNAPPQACPESKRQVTSRAPEPGLTILKPRVVAMASSAFKPTPTSPANNPTRNYKIDVPATTYTDLRSQGPASAVHSPQSPNDEVEYEQRSSVGSNDDNNADGELSASSSSVKWGNENGFDVVFQQQSMGMKLGYDPVKKCAIVKECFEGTESKKYKQITSGVAIMSVNGQSLCGISLSKIMSRLREAQRPAVIRFETESP